MSKDVSPFSLMMLIRPTRLAKLLSVDVSTIWRWRKTGVLPPPRQIGSIIGWTPAQIADALGIDLNDLVHQLEMLSRLPRNWRQAEKSRPQRERVVNWRG